MVAAALELGMLMTLLPGLVLGVPTVWLFKWIGLRRASWFVAAGLAIGAIGIELEDVLFMSEARRAYCEGWDCSPASACARDCAAENFQDMWMLARGLIPGAAAGLGYWLVAQRHRQP